MIGTVWAETRTWGECSAVPNPVMAKNFTRFDALAEHSSVNREKYAAVLSFLIIEFKN